MKRSVKSVALLLLAVFVIVLSDSSNAFAASGEKGKVVVGGRDWAEPYILSYLIGFSLEDAGYQVEYKLDIADSLLLQESLVKGDIDITVNYSGTIYESVLGHTPIYDKDEEYRTIKKELAEKGKIVALAESNINNSYAMVVTKETAKKYGIVKTSDLAKVSNKLTFADPGVFWSREKKRLQGLYGDNFDWKSANTFDKGLRYKALLNGLVDVTVAFTTDAELNDPNIFRVTDDVPTYQPYYIVPLVRQKVIAQYPDIEGVVNAIFAKLIEEDMVKLNYLATVEKKDYDAIARAWYDENIKK
jgi:glycine betaine/choline ABC-type transport system substrate-binding protein